MSWPSLAKSALWVFALGAIGAFGGMIFAPPGELIPSATGGVVIMIYLGSMFRRTLKVSLTSLFAGWILGGAIVGLILGLIKGGTISEIFISVARFAMIGVLWAIFDSMIRAWR